MAFYDAVRFGSLPRE